MVVALVAGRREVAGGRFRWQRLVVGKASGDDQSAQGRGGDRQHGTRGHGGGDDTPSVHVCDRAMCLVRIS